MASRRATVTAARPDFDFLKRQAAHRLGNEVDLRRTLWMKYGADVDMLTIRFKQSPGPTHSKSDELAGIIYNYEGEELVSIEILDISE